MKKHSYLICIIVFTLFAVSIHTAEAFWVWSPKDKSAVNPKYAVKDAPHEQFDWAMRFYKQGDFQRAADEFNRLTSAYPDSDISPEAQYYAGRSYEELGKYYFAFQNYQKTLDNYPYTKRMEEILEREFNIAGIFQSEAEPKLMDIELSLSLERAIEIYQKIIDTNAFGPLADKSMYRMAECFRRGLKYKDSIDAYEKLINDYPESDLIEEAKYQLAYTRYEASLAAEYDQEKTDEALAEFKQISMTTAIPKVAEEADKVLFELKEKKAKSLISIATFYEKRKKYKSAMIYYKEAVSKYPDTTAAEEARERIEAIKPRMKE